MPHFGHLPGGRAVRRRDQGRRRVRLVTVGVTVAAAAGSVVLGTGYAQSLPGKASATTGAVLPPTRTPAPAAPGPRTAGAGTPTPARTASATPSRHPHRSTTAPRSLQPPAQPPTAAAPVQQAPQPAPTTTSGAS